MSLLAVAHLGCGLVQVNGKPVGKPSGLATTAAPPAGDGSAADPAAGNGTATGNDAATAAMVRGVLTQYAGWTYATCRGTGRCERQFAEAAGLSLGEGEFANPRGLPMPNPDPEWIPGWDKIPNFERGWVDVIHIMQQAASNKTWVAACNAQYEIFKAEVDEEVANARARLKPVLAMTDDAQRIRALLSLRRELDVGDASVPPTSAAAAFEIEAAIIDGLRQANKLWLLEAKGLLPSEAARRSLLPRWEAALEPRAFCYEARNGWQDTLDALPPNDQAGQFASTQYIKPVFSDAELTELERLQAERELIAQRALDATSTAVAPDRNAERIRLRTLSLTGDTHLISFSRKGEGAVVQAVSRRRYNRSIGETCRTRGTGAIVPCPIMAVNVVETTTIRFAAWPTGVVLEAGDELGYFTSAETHDMKGNGTPRQTDEITVRAELVDYLTKPDGSAYRYLPASP